MLSSIITCLKKGSIKAVVPFSDSMKTPPLPYVCVKPETGVIQNTRQYRIIVHHNAGYINELQDYVLKELDGLLLSGYLYDGNGRRYKLYANGYTDITADPDDDTYFMERIYYAPLLIR